MLKKLSEEKLEELLEAGVEEVTGSEAGFKEYVRRIIRALRSFSRVHAGYVRLYCTLTASGGAEAKEAGRGD